ncbi:MAG: Alpha/beta hydrolase fold-3 domain protein [Actinomycetia bacterium]|nr:Alpha/beta hydrolase fold-3 domain protein [Actinomycetes bacterium]
MLAETRAFNEELEQALALVPPVQDLPPEVTRRARRAGRGVFPAPVFLDNARTETARGVPVRIFEPPDSEGAYLHVHGGGWVFGGADMQDELLWELAQESRLTVVSVDYRLAPEHPYPAGPDDCEAAALWFLDRYEGRLTIGGESAGAHLAVLTLLRLRDRHGISPRTFAVANLVFGAFDLTGTPSCRLWGDRNLILSTPTVDWYADCFLPGMPDRERRSPEVSPLFADLHDLPPALFSCGTLDPLLDDSLFMEARWRAAGNEATLSLWEEGVHGFVFFPLELEIARRSNAEQTAFLRR